MLILFLNPVGVIGGAERVLLDLITSLHAAVPAVKIHLITGSDGPLVEAARAVHASVTVLPLPPAIGDMGDYALASGQKGARLSILAKAPLAAWSTWRYARRLRRLIQRLQPTVVHSNGIKLHLLTRLARLHGATVVWHVHDFVGSRPLMARALRWAGRAADGVVAISHAVAQDAERIVPYLSVAVVPNAIDTDRFAPGPGDGTRLDRLANLRAPGPTVVRVGLVATYALWKGHDLFIKAARQVIGELSGADIRFFIVGGPIYQTRGSQWSEDELRRQGADLLVAGQLGFLGFQQDIPEVYRALDIVVHASTRPEPFGLTIAEAMSCGRAVVVTQGGGASELFVPDHDAVGVPAGDAEALARAIIDLINDPAKRQRLGLQARATALERFRRERLGPQILEAYARFGVVVPGCKLTKSDSSNPFTKTETPKDSI